MATETPVPAGNQAGQGLDAIIDWTRRTARQTQQAIDTGASSRSTLNAADANGKLAKMATRLESRKKENQK